MASSKHNKLLVLVPLVVAGVAAVHAAAAAMQELLHSLLCTVFKAHDFYDAPSPEKAAHHIIHAMLELVTALLAHRLSL